MKFAIAIAAMLSATAVNAQQTNGGRIFAVMQKLAPLTKQCELYKKDCAKVDALVAELKQLGQCFAEPYDAPLSQRWSTSCDDIAEVQPVTSSKAWYGRDLNKSSCIESGSPADKMRSLQSDGRYASAKDLPGGAVEVSTELSGGRTQYWEFYPTHSACHATLPRSQAIPNRYE